MADNEQHDHAGNEDQPNEEEPQDEEGVDGGDDQGGPPDVNGMLQDPNFMGFFLRMLQAEAEKNDASKKKERKVAAEVQVAALRSRKHELRQLAVDALPPLLASLDKNVWKVIIKFCEAKELSRMAATCWFFRALTEDDSYWEKIFAREIGGVSIVTRRCTSFRERFFLAQKFDDIVEALATAELGDEVILCPGIYERKEEDDPFGFSGLKVGKKRITNLFFAHLFQVHAGIHIIGCCFNRSNSADLNCNHAADLPKPLSEPNIVLRSQYTNALDWRAKEGSVTNVHLAYMNPDPNKARQRTQRTKDWK